MVCGLSVSFMGQLRPPGRKAIKGLGGRGVGWPFPDFYKGPCNDPPGGWRKKGRAVKGRVYGCIPTSSQPVPAPLTTTSPPPPCGGQRKNRGPGQKILEVIFCNMQ